MRVSSAWRTVSLLLLLSSCGRAQERSPADFEYYLLSLSWSPEFCYSHPGNAECGRSYGFIVHGLWPQSRAGRGPEYCSHAPGLPDPRPVLGIMPDPALIRHEWQAHGTCTGLSADAYFELVRRAFASIHIPRQFLAPRGEMRAAPSQIVRSFEQANPGLPRGAVQLTLSTSAQNY